MENRRDNPLKLKSYDFALRIVGMYRELVAAHEYALSKQLLKSGTSIGANIAEANQAQSRPDFISKLSIALKEAVETEYWLELLRDSRYINDVSAKPMLADCRELKAILTASIKSSKNRI